MKTLILSCDMGGGHNSAAKALAQWGERNGIPCEIADTLSFISTDFSRTMSDLYIFTTKSNLIKVIYKTGEIVPRSRRVKSPVYVANKIYCKRLCDHIIEGGFTSVICTHVFPAEAMTALRRAGLLPSGLRTVFVQTDYDALTLMKDLEVDAIVIPHPHLIEECVAIGARRDLLHPFGIPVSEECWKHVEKSAAREECAALFSGSGHIGISAGWYLIMSGSMGFGKTGELIRTILEAEGCGVEILAVCGSNTKLRNRLCKDFGENANVHPIGFTDRVPLLMDACDVLFTKPGGLSSTEAAAKRIPLIHTAPIPGCETDNARFFHYHGMSYSTTDTAQQVAVARRLCTDTAFRDSMTAAQASNTFPDTCGQIFTLLASGKADSTICSVKND